MPLFFFIINSSDINKSFSNELDKEKETISGLLIQKDHVGSFL